MVSQMSEAGASNDRMMRSAQWRSLNTVNRYILQSEEDKRKTNRMLTSTEIIKYNPESKPEEPESTPKSGTAI